MAPSGAIVFMRMKSAWLCCLFLALLGGCASSAPAFRMLPNWFAGQHAVVDDFIAQGKLNPAYAYLRVTPEGFPSSLAVLAYVDASSSGPVLTWYFAQGQVLKTQQGRLVGVSGVPQSVAGARYSPAAIQWPNPGELYLAERTWDAPLQYKFGLHETLELTRIPQEDVPKHVWRHLQQVAGNPSTVGWTWFRQQGAITSNAWFALATVRGTAQVVYSYQCVDATLCMHLVPWPVAEVVLP